jgi:hypothetical protein
MLYTFVVMDRFNMIQEAQVESVLKLYFLIQLNWITFGKALVDAKNEISAYKRIFEENMQNFSHIWFVIS